MLIAQLLKNKGSNVFTVTEDDLVASISALLHTRRVGAFVVTDRLGRVVGIISERDVIRAIAQEGAAALDKPASGFMTRDVISAEPSQTVDTLLACMTDRKSGIFRSWKATVLSALSRSAIW